MNNNQFLPFERNRYYAGKMLTSADFIAEQKYFLEKQRFLNNMMYGSGIVCGLGVVSLDDLSILVESGVAIDGLGREIVVESSVVKKLSTVEGFDTLESDRATLCLRYDEQEGHSVYSVGHFEGENHYENNRITEGFRLYLADSDSLEEGFVDEGEFLARESLFADLNYEVEIELPGTVSLGKSACILVRARKVSSSPVSLTYQGSLQTPGFENAAGGHTVDVNIDGISLEMGETWEKRYWFTCVGGEGMETSIILESGSAKATVGGVDAAVNENFSIKILIEKEPPRTLVNRAVGQTSLEMRAIGDSDDFIRLAELKLVRTDTAYVIEEVQEKQVKKYLNIPSQDELRSKYLGYFIKNADIRQVVGGSPMMQQARPMEHGGNEIMERASGVLEIPLGTDAREGDICYSGEIIHGLGVGNVYVDVGYEFVSDDPDLNRSGRSTVYGNSQLFTGGGIPEAETAVKVFNDKGSFVVAVRLLRNVDFLTLTYRWVATRFPSGMDIRKIENIKDKSISAETPTFVMGPKESHYFGVRYHNMEPASLTYELTEAASGEITSDGVYTAPSKEGVYEIKIYCTDSMLISTYAYAIVKNKDGDA